MKGWKMILLAVSVLVLDRLTKIWAEGIRAPFSLIPGIVGLTYTENTGMAFSMLSGNSMLLGFISLGLIVLGFLVFRRYRLDGLTRVALMLMLGGAAGNLIDRLFVGYVVDMIALEFVDFAIFNVADAALTTGCALLALSLLFRPGAWEKKGGERNG